MTRSRDEPATASVQVGVRVTETFSPGDLAAPRRLTALLTRFQSFKPEAAVFWAEAVATYETPGRPTAKRGCEAARWPSRKWPVSVCRWPRGLAVGAVSVDGSPVSLACGGGESLRAEVVSPVARRAVEVSWTVDAELLGFLAEKCPAPDGYGAAPAAVSVEVRANLFGSSEQALRRILRAVEAEQKLTGYILRAMEVAVAVTPAATEDRGRGIVTSAAGKVNTGASVIYDADSPLASLYETPPMHDRAWSSYLRGECYVCGASARTCHTTLRVSTKFTGEGGWETALANHAGPVDVFGSCGHYLFTFARRLRRVAVAAL